MPKPTDSFFTPPSSYSPQKTLARLDLGFDSPSDDVLDADIFNMTGTGSPQPFIKEEVDDMSFNTSRFVGHNAFDMNQPYANPQFGSNQDNVNPSELNMSQSMMGGQFGSTSYIQGAAGIADDELADSLGGGYDQQPNYNGFGHGNTNHQDYYHSHTNNPTMNQIYSNTPDDLPIQSPFVHPGAFDFNQYHTPSRMNFAGSMPNAMRPARASMSRHASDNRTPMSPKTPALATLNIGTPDSGNFTTQPIMANTRGGHKSSASMSNPGSMPWEGTPASPHSWIDSPVTPHTATMHHQQIADVLHSGKHSSLPAKVDIGQTQDAKKRRRRESHNLVERRRRDNINERIHDLSRLVPQHRLEDEKIRKHINNNGPMSPTMGTSGMSPPQATSLLAGGSGRRAAGNITQGLPIEDKDKGPNKGDILNGAVSWTRDLMWMLHKKIQECDDLAARLQQATGEEWSTEQSEDEKRMKTEIMEALEKNGTGTFRYSRGPGSGLRVPHHTNLAGEPVNGISPQSLSPGMQSTGSGSASNQPYWSNQSLKEEDEYGMDMG